MRKSLPLGLSSMMPNTQPWVVITSDLPTTYFLEKTWDSSIWTRSPSPPSRKETRLCSTSTCIAFFITRKYLEIVSSRLPVSIATATVVCLMMNAPTQNTNSALSPISVQIVFSNNEMVVRQRVLLHRILPEVKPASLLPAFLMLKFRDEPTNHTTCKHSVY